MYVCMIMYIFMHVCMNIYICTYVFFTPFGSVKDFLVLWKEVRCVNKLYIELFKTILYTFPCTNTIHKLHQKANCTNHNS